MLIVILTFPSWLERRKHRHGWSFTSQTFGPLAKDANFHWVTSTPIINFFPFHPCQCVHFSKHVCSPCRHQRHPQQQNCMCHSRPQYFLLKKKKRDSFLSFFLKKKSQPQQVLEAEKRPRLNFARSKPRRSEQGTTEALTRPPVRLKVSSDERDAGEARPRLLPPRPQPTGLLFSLPSAAFIA